MKTKAELTAAGLALMGRFCAANHISVPTTAVRNGPSPFGACAWYRQDSITIHPSSCAHIGTGGAAWSYPGYFIDRTPYGVIQHELGHHVDFTLGDQKAKYSSEFSINLRRESGEEKITNYCPNDAEWFAEMFRLFVTNPDLLKAIRPGTYALLAQRFTTVENATWGEVLAGAPPRNLQQCARRIVESSEAALPLK